MKLASVSKLIAKRFACSGSIVIVTVVSEYQSLARWL